LNTGKSKTVELCDIASVDEINRAIEQLTSADHLRIRKAAQFFLPGTEYRSPGDLIHEAIVRTIYGAKDASGKSGRHWPKSVPFDCFMINTMKSIADGSRRSTYVSRRASVETLEDEPTDSSSTVNNLLVPSAEQVAFQDSEETDTPQHTDAQIIRTYFQDDPAVAWLIDCLSDGGCPRKDWSTAGLTRQQYEAARKRLRRGIEKLFPGRSKR
jgi:hypothetical protein